jgi:hypothetical protein
MGILVCGRGGELAQAPDQAACGAFGWLMVMDWKLGGFVVVIVGRVDGWCVSIGRLDLMTDEGCIAGSLIYSKVSGIEDWLVVTLQLLLPSIMR